MDNPLELIKKILEWAEAILTLLSGGMVYFFNILAILLGLLPWFVSISLWFVIARNRLSNERAFVFGNGTAGIVVTVADLSYRNYFNTGSSLANLLNWISPYRGGQFMFVPLWLLGIGTTVLIALYLMGRATFLEGFFKDSAKTDQRPDDTAEVPAPMLESPVSTPQSQAEIVEVPGSAVGTPQPKSPAGDPSCGSEAPNLSKMTASNR